MTRPTHHDGAADVTPAESESPWANIAPLLDAALARLAAPDRDAVLLKFIQGKSHRDVGSQLGISVTSFDQEGCPFGWGVFQRFCQQLIYFRPTVRSHKSSDECAPAYYPPG